MVYCWKRLRRSYCDGWILQNLNFRCWVTKPVKPVTFIIIKLFFRWQRIGRMPWNVPSEYPKSSTVRDHLGYGNSQAYARSGMRLFGFVLSPGEVHLQSWGSCKFPVTLGSYQRLCMWLPRGEGLSRLDYLVMFSKQHRHWSWGTYNSPPK